MNNEKIPFIVFEGPDMCGKSSHIETVVNELNRITGKNFKQFKFPVYSGFKGSQILYHLKTFDVRNKTKTTDIHNVLVELTDHAINLMVNKFDAYNECVKESENCDGFIVDRFDLSQYIYDIAWCNFFNVDKKHIKRRDVRKFFYEAGYRAFVTNEYFSQKFDIKYIVFNRSNVIKTMAMNDESRRIDKYDLNYVYQQNISDLFETFTDDMRPTFIEVVCNMYDSEFTLFNNFLVLLKKLSNPLFDCLTNKNNDVMHNIYHNIIENTICKINTDEIYRNVFWEECIENQGNDVNSAILPNLIYTDANTVDMLVSKYKDQVTSRIDKEIIDNITKYLEESDER